MKSLEVGGEIRALQESSNGWWTFDHAIDHAIAGKSMMRYTNSAEKYGILNHIFVGGGLTWNVYVRTVLNKEGSTTTWVFVKPDGLTDTLFEEQMINFDTEDR